MRTMKIMVITTTRRYSSYTIRLRQLISIKMAREGNIFPRVLPLREKFSCFLFDTYFYYVEIRIRCRHIFDSNTLDILQPSPAPYLLLPLTPSPHPRLCAPRKVNNLLQNWSRKRINIPKLKCCARLQNWRSCTPLSNKYTSFPANKCLQYTLPSMYSKCDKRATQTRSNTFSSYHQIPYHLFLLLLCHFVKDFLLGLQGGKEDPYLFEHRENILIPPWNIKILPIKSKLNNFQTLSLQPKAGFSTL